MRCRVGAAAAGSSSSRAELASIGQGDTAAAGTWVLVGIYGQTAPGAVGAIWWDPWVDSSARSVSFSGECPTNTDSGSACTLNLSAQIDVPDRVTAGQSFTVGGKGSITISYSRIFTDKYGYATVDAGDQSSLQPITLTVASPTGSATADVSGKAFAPVPPTNSVDELLDLPLRVQFGWAVGTAGSAYEPFGGVRYRYVPADLGYPIMGTVYDVTGAPLAGATVSSDCVLATVDASGIFTLSLTAGTHTLVAEQSGYWFSPESQSVTVGIDQLIAYQSWRDIGKMPVVNLSNTPFIGRQPVLSVGPPSVPADGSHFASVGISGVPPNHLIQFLAQPSDGVTFTPASGDSGPGTFLSQVRSTKPGVVTITAKDVTAGQTYLVSGSVTFTDEQGGSAALSVPATRLGGNRPAPIVGQPPNCRPANSAPYTPRNPLPADQATREPVTTTANVKTLTWTGGDPDTGDTVTYSLVVYTDTTKLPVLTASNIANRNGSASYALPKLSFDTTYSWQVTAIDSRGASTKGPTWTFKTQRQLVLRGIEVTQAIQDWGNSIRLFADRRTFVRAFVESRDGAVNGLRAELLGRDAVGNPLTPPSVTLINRNNQVNVPAVANRALWKDGFVFELPNTWIASGTTVPKTIELEFRLVAGTGATAPALECADHAGVPNDCKVSVSLKAVPKARLRLRRVETAGPQGVVAPGEEAITQTKRLLESMAPVSLEVQDAGEFRSPLGLTLPLGDRDWFSILV